MFPCLPHEAIQMLTGTADERYATSPTYFNNTHFPQVMHRYVNATSIQKWTEQDLLTDLLQNPPLHNRIYAVLGSTGAGKSELLCWLKDRWEQGESDRPVIRISRTELNPQLLISKCCQTLGVSLNVQLDESRWEILLQKPITIVNQLIWSALSELYEKDEDIVPRALLFRPVVEENVVRFSRQIQEGMLEETPELLSAEQYEALVKHTTLSLHLEYDAFRRLLVEKFDHFLFHGEDIVTLMKRLSALMMTMKIRPLLLIDDLVQSVNLYASHLLDLFLTVEEGNWDVVLGMTPGAFQDSEKGRSLVHRFLTLDTIDDRITKLWLSDEMGQAFFTLHRDQAVPFVMRYLRELKRTQGYHCTIDCPHAKQCAAVHPTAPEEDLPLAPLNRHLVHRLYDGIPIGKGKLRFLILHTKEMLRFFHRGAKASLEQLEQTAALLRRDCYAEHPDPFVKQLTEWVADPIHPDEGIAPELLGLFGRIAQLRKPAMRNLHPIQALAQPPSMADSLAPIRDWLEGKEVNRELLEPIRSGMAALIHDVTKATLLSRSHTARAGTVLQRSVVENRVRYPIYFPDTRDRTRNNTHCGNVNIEIGVPRDSFAFDIAGYQQKRPQERAEAFTQLASSWHIAEWVYAGENLHVIWKQEVERELGMPLFQFAYQLKVWSERWQVISQNPWAQSLSSPFRASWMSRVESLFADWFLLRDNMVDGELLEGMLLSYDFDLWWVETSFSTAFDHFQLDDESFGRALQQQQQEVREYQIELWDSYIRFCDQVTLWLPQIQRRSPTRAEQALTLLQMRVHGRCSLVLAEQTADLYAWCHSNKLEEEAHLLAHLHHQTSASFERWQVIREKISELSAEHGLPFSSIENTHADWGVAWEVEEARRQEMHWRNQVEAIALFVQTLLATRPTLFQALVQEDPCLFSVHAGVSDWTEVDRAGRLILRGIELTEEDLHLLRRWSALPFAQIEQNWLLNQERSLERGRLLLALADDLGWQSEIVENYAEWVPILERDSRLRARIKGVMKKLLLDGVTTLPQVQGSGIMEDLQALCPHLFRELQVQLVPRKQRKTSLK